MERVVETHFARRAAKAEIAEQMTAGGIRGSESEDSDADKRTGGD